MSTLTLNNVFTFSKDPASEFLCIFIKTVEKGVGVVSNSFSQNAQAKAVTKICVCSQDQYLQMVYTDIQNSSFGV